MRPARMFDFINELYIYFAILLLLLLIEKKVSSLFVVCLVLLGTSGLMEVTREPLTVFILRDVSAYQFVWYVGYSMLNVCAVFLMLRLHQHLNLKVTYPCIFTALCCIFSMLLQMVELLNQLSFKSMVFQDVYRFMIPAIDDVVILGLMLSTLYSLWKLEMERRSI
ncbi:hypothetical protein [Algicola sagamiensis]|uniref:hypothetical protein n=1 Tax=Algicola sagamiensis TaxID=163869 RepID=UPI00036AA6CA|nr:hypothetical protein [Algicola sagamiensis]